MRFKSRCLLALILITSFFLEGYTVAFAAASEGLIQAEEIDALFNKYVTDNDLNPDLISVAYVYTPTGETWYHLEDQWYYSASLYKVPLMMLLTEKEHDGELTRESEINGMSLEAIEEEILVNSNNPIAYSTLRYLAQPDICRRMFCRYSELPEDYYTWDFFGGSYFTARFMTDVMYTLFREPDRFPRMIDCLKRAQPDHYFHLKLGDRYEIAQKYGNYCDEYETDWNHTTGIIYTPNPFILTVMTKYGGISETIIGDLAALFCDYTLQADTRLAASEKLSSNDVTNSSESDKALPAETDSNVTDADPPNDDTYNAQTSSVSEKSPTEEFSQETQIPTGLTKQSVSRLMLIAGCFAVELILLFLSIVLRRRK